MMKLTVTSRQQTEFIEITADIQRLVGKRGIQNGICMLFVPHTTAAVTINENADPTVKSDIQGVLNRIIPWEADYRHLEGNSAAHIKASLMGASELIAVEGGRLVLGTWQGIFFCEFDGPRTRSVHIHFIGS
jgi:secondary thiamine-phosphate synthase enzyme